MWFFGWLLLRRSDRRNGTHAELALVLTVALGLLIAGALIDLIQWAAR